MSTSKVRTGACLRELRHRGSSKEMHGHLLGWVSRVARMEGTGTWQIEREDRRKREPGLRFIFLFYKARAMWERFAALRDSFRVLPA